MTALEQIQKYNAFMQKVFHGRVLKGGDVSTLLEEVIKIVEEHQLFERDTITGRLRSIALSDDPEHIIEATQAQNLFKTFFCDKLFVMQKKQNKGEEFSVPQPVPDAQQNVIYNQMIQLCTYNSRTELYERIPEWDGVERIKTFLKDYFMCNAHWHYFLLFLTYVVGKIKDPATCRVEHWFDFVGSAKGTGKSTFFKHLLEGIGCGKQAFDAKMNGRTIDDFWVNCYNANAIIAIDDECHWLEKVSYEELKSMTTQQTDTFSRKYLQPETHFRPFVIVRTSNHPKTVYSVNERRQIIFNVGLPEHTCLHWNLSNEYMAQLLAEAKDYYEKNGGCYKLTEEEQDAIITQNLENTSIETPEYRLVTKFVEMMLDPDTPLDDKLKYTIALKKEPAEGYLWTNWSKFSDFIESSRLQLGNLKQGNVFYKTLDIYSRKNKGVIFCRDETYRTLKTNSETRAFGIKTSVPDPDEVPDIPF